eukprot:1341382-Pleurochrysis_carterae.AAC.1
MSTSIGAIAACRVGLSIDEVMALHPASCMDLAEGEEATEEGVLEPYLQLEVDPPLPALEAVFDALAMKDTRRRYGLSCWSPWTLAASSGTSSIWMCAWRIGFNSVVSSDASLFRCSRPEDRSYPGRHPRRSTRGCGRRRRRAGQRISPVPFPLPQVSEHDTDRLTRVAKTVKVEEYFPSSPDSPLVQRAEEEAIHARLHDYSRQSFMFLHIQPGQVYSSATRGEGIASLSALDRAGPAPDVAMGDGGEAAEMAWEGTYVKEIWLTVEHPILRVLSGVGQDLQDGPE